MSALTCSHSSAASLFKFTSPIFAQASKCLRNYSGRAFRNLKIAKLRFSDPCHTARIVGGAEFASRGPAQIIHQHVMIFGSPGVIVHDALEDFQQADDF